MKKIFKSFAIVTSTSILTRFLSFIFKIYLSRTLGAELLGIYQIAFSVIMTFVAICASGLPVTLSRITAENNSLFCPQKSNNALSTCLCISLVFAIAVCSVFIAFPQLANLLFSDARCIPVFYIMLPLLLTTAVYSCLRGWFWGNKHYGIYSATEFTDEVAKIILCIILFSGVITSVSLQNAYAVAMVASDIIVVVLLVFFFLFMGGKFSKPAYAKSIVKSSMPLTMTRVSGSFITMTVSLLLPVILVKFCGMSVSNATAEYGRATGMVMPLLFAPSAITGSLAVVIIPELASYNASGNTKKIEQTLSLSLKFSCIVSAFFFIIYASMGELLGQLLYKDSQAGIYLAFSSVIMLPMSMHGILVSTLNSLGKELDTFICHLTGYIALLVCIFALSPFIGIYAYFIAFFAFQTVCLAVNFAKLSKQVKFQSKTLVSCGGICLFSVILVLMLNPLTSLLSGIWGNIACITAGIIICTTTYLIYLVLSKTLTKNDIKLLYKK